MDRVTCIVDCQRSVQEPGVGYPEIEVVPSARSDARVFMPSVFVIGVLEGPTGSGWWQ
jgi:hypothetical protein